MAGIMEGWKDGRMEWREHGEREEENMPLACYVEQVQDVGTKQQPHIFSSFLLP